MHALPKRQVVYYRKLFTLGYPNASEKNVPCLDSISEIKSWHSHIIAVGYTASKIDKSVCLSIQNQP